MTGSVRKVPVSRPVCGVTAPCSAPTCQTRPSAALSAAPMRGRVSGPLSVSRPQPGVTEPATARMVQTRLAVGFINWDCWSFLGVWSGHHVMLEIGKKSSQTSETLSVLYYVYMEWRDTIKQTLQSVLTVLSLLSPRAIKSPSNKHLGKLNCPQVYILLDILLPL